MSNTEIKFHICLILASILLIIYIITGHIDLMCPRCGKQYKTRGIPLPLYSLKCPDDGQELFEHEMVN